MQRNGLQRFLNLAHVLCVFFGHWRGSVIAAVNASGATTEQKAQLLGLINAIDQACSAVDSLRMVWE